MKRTVTILLAVAGGLVVLLSVVFLTKQWKHEPKATETLAPEIRDIVSKTVAAGAIVPRKEVAVKPRVSGLIKALHAEPGQQVEAGQRIATIKIIPNMISLNAAEARVRTAQLRRANAKREEKRFAGLHKRQLIAEAELTRRRLDFDLAKQEVRAAQSNLQLIREGASKSGGKISNEVYSPVDGMVLDMPVEEGVSVTETNNFNAGTTIATVANMSDLIFKGTVDESEVGKLKVGMDLNITISALQGERFDGKLEFIAPKGTSNNGAIKFEIRAAIKARDDVFVRANYSANADVVLDKREQVLAINESALTFDGGTPFVDVRVAPQRFEHRSVKLGLSDGVWAEVLEGVTAQDTLKKP